MRIQLYLIAITIITASVGFTACEDSIPCNADIKPGPVRIQIDCVDEARADLEQLGNEPLLVEYLQGDGGWKLCDRESIYMGDDSSEDLTKQLCAVGSDHTLQFECGHRAGTFEIRARQGDRSAGPIEVTAKLQKGRAGQCGNYTDSSLNYELSLDVVE